MLIYIFLTLLHFPNPHALTSLPPTGMVDHSLPLEIFIPNVTNVYFIIRKKIYVDRKMQDFIFCVVFIID